MRVVEDTDQVEPLGDQRFLLVTEDEQVIALEYKSLMWREVE